MRERSKKEPRPVRADVDARYASVKEYDVSRLSPQVAKPHTVDNGATVESLSGVKIDQAFLGTCTNGRLEDLEIAAKIMKGHKVASGVKLLVAPASQGIFLQAP